MAAVKAFAEGGGKVLGICNGFQILCEAGMLPGALLQNDNQKYVCKNIYLRAVTKESAITRVVQVGKAIKVPIAHGDGRYYADAETLKKMKAKNQILLQDCDSLGAINDGANPNGSVENIAAICNEARNVYGMMPHPERASETDLGNTDGRAILESILASDVLTGTA
jgi:phosphoribosylformylglycinamidine synthase